MVTKIDGKIPQFNVALPEKRTEALKSDVPAENTGAAPAVSVAPAYGFHLRVDQDTKEVTAVIVDATTRAVIREIPSKEMRIASNVIRNLLGPLIDKTV
jgi:FlaG protein